MSGLSLVLLVLCAPPEEGITSVTYTISPGALTPAAVAQKPLVPLRKGAELREAVHKALRQWAKPSDNQAEAAARQFVALYDELLRDDQLSRSQREQLRLQVRGRLASLAAQISKRIAADRRLAKGDRPPSVQSGGSGVLGQMGGFGQPGPGGMGGPWGQPGGFGAMGPGMGGMMPGAMGTGGLLADCGQELVDLIQKTIAPQSWDVNGGPGSIYYWQPGRALVVSASQDVHEQLGGLVDQLQRAGR